MWQKLISSINDSVEKCKYIFYARARVNFDLIEFSRIEDTIVHKLKKNSYLKEHQKDRAGTAVAGVA